MRISLEVDAGSRFVKFAAEPHPMHANDLAEAEKMVDQVYQEAKAWFAFDRDRAERIRTAKRRGVAPA